MPKLKSYFTLLEIVGVVLIVSLFFSSCSPTEPEPELKPVELNGTFVTDWFILQGLETFSDQRPKYILDDRPLPVRGQTDHPISEKTWKPYTAPHSVVALFGGVGEKRSKYESRILTAYAYRKFDSLKAETVLISIGCTDDARLWLNGELLLDQPPLPSEKFAIRQYSADLKAGQNSVLIALPHQSGHGGFTFQIGSSSLIQAQEITQLVRGTTIFQFSVLGFSLALAVLHLFIFIFYPDLRENLYYAVFVLFSGLTFALWFSVSDPFFTHSLTVFYGFFAISWLAGLRFVYAVSLDVLPRRFFLFVVMWSLVFITKIPAELGLIGYERYGLLQHLYHVTAIAQLVEMFRIVIRLSFQQRARSGVLILGIITFELTILYNVLIDFGFLDKQFYTQPAVMAGYVFNLTCYSVYLAREIAVNHQSLHRLNQKLAEINQAIFRFVPQKMLSYMGRQDDIIAVKLGDQKQLNMTVLFTDIRDFTALSEKMSPEENFDFINDLLERIGPVIRQQNGFIDKYMGDAIMALFPESADDAVSAGIKILEEVQTLNQQRVKDGLMPIKLGVGIHTGELMLGIIGESERIEGTVISDVVNTSARLEGLTKRYECSMLVSQDTLDHLQDASHYQSRFIEQVQVKGRKGVISVHEIYNADPADLRDQKKSTHTRLKQGIDCYYQRDFDKAQKIMTDILATFPADQVAKLYRQQAVRYLETGVADDWNGVVEMIEK